MLRLKWICALPSALKMCERSASYWGPPDAPYRIVSSWVDDLDCSSDDSVASPAGVSPAFILLCSDISVLASAFSVSGYSVVDAGRMVVADEESSLH